MPVELKILALGALLLLVHIFAAIAVQDAAIWPQVERRRARRGAVRRSNPMAGRLQRAEANFQETFPIAIVALLGVVAGRTARADGLRSAAGSGSARG